MFDKIADQLLRNPGGGRPPPPQEPTVGRSSTEAKRPPHVAVENPWGVTPAEAAALDAVVKHGGNREAAAALGVTIRTIEGQRCNGSQSIPGATPLLRMLRWYEFRREALGLDKEFKA